MECPFNCNGNGECLSGTCQCFPGFLGPYCSRGMILRLILKRHMNLTIFFSFSSSVSVSCVCVCVYVCLCVCVVCGVWCVVCVCVNVVCVLCISLFLTMLYDHY